MDTVKIATWERDLEIDPYRADTNGLTHPGLTLRPQDWTLHYEQIRSGDGTPMPLWEGRWVRIDLGDDPSPDPDELRQYLESDEAQAILTDACESEGEARHDCIVELETAIGRLNRDSTVYATAEEACNGYEQEYLDNNNGDVAEAAKDIASDARSQGWVLVDDAETYLAKWLERNSAA